MPFSRWPATILFDLGNTVRNRQASFQHEDIDVSKGEMMNLRPCHTSPLQNPDRSTVEVSVQPFTTVDPQFQAYILAELALGFNIPIKIL